MTVDDASKSVAVEGVAVRGAEPGDADACARIVHDAFAGIHDRHRFPRDFPSVDAAAQLVGNLIAHPSVWGIVAEADDRVIGSNFLDQRGPVAGVGPITIDPKVQGSGVGRLLMRKVIERGANDRGIRLFQDSFNMQSLALYASLGFGVKEPAVVVTGVPSGAPMSGVDVRPLTGADVDECEQLCIRVHGFERTAELRDALEVPVFTPVVAVRDGRIVAYSTTVTFFPAAYGVAETEADMCALIAGGATLGDAPVSIIVPHRQADLFRWCLARGLRPIKPLTYMTLGEWHEPDGAWIPSIMY